MFPFYSLEENKLLKDVIRVLGDQTGPEAILEYLKVTHDIFPTQVLYLGGEGCLLECQHMPMSLFLTFVLGDQGYRCHSRASSRVEQLRHSSSSVQCFRCHYPGQVHANHRYRNHSGSAPRLDRSVHCLGLIIDLYVILTRVNRSHVTR